MSAKQGVLIGVAALLALIVPATVPAQSTYPAKPIRWIVAYPAGGGSDFLARTVATPLAQLLGQPVVVENRPGAATIVGAEAAAQSAPDGYTLFTGDNGSLVFNPALYKKLPYSVGSFSSVGLMARFPLILVTNSDTKVGSARELISLAKAAPGKFSYASPGAGSPHHLAMELLKDRTGTFVVHVPYRGAAPAVQDLIGKQVEMMMLDTAVGLPQIRGGKIRALAVASRARLPQLPDVPTLAEAGFNGVEVYAWQGLAVPAGTPASVIDALSAALQKALARPEVRKSLFEFGLDVTPGEPRAMSEYIVRETTVWHALIRNKGLSVE